MAYCKIYNKKQSPKSRVKNSDSTTVKKCKTGKIKHNITVVDDIKFDSALESKYYIYLKGLKEKGIVKDIQLQPEFILQEKFIIYNNSVVLESHDNYKILKRKYKLEVTRGINYIADFKVEYSDGRVEIVDTKGIETADFKIKKKMFRYKYPHLTLKIIILYKGEWIEYDDYKKYKRTEKRNLKK